MAVDTPKNYRNQVMYSVFVRNHTPEGTFQALRADLKRIRDLGVDILWLMPIHPLGKAARKGSLGSPYAIQNYREINPEFGDLEDFKDLVADIHSLGMKCIIDVVYNHTSPDSWLAANHPEWFYRKPDGSMGNRIGDWTDVVDLDYSHPELWDYQIETLKYWAQWVDGFRCDVAPMVPLEFWLRARKEVAQVRPGAIWLAESVEAPFVRFVRRDGIPTLSDGEIYRAFDLAYDYDVFGAYKRYVAGETSLSHYLAALIRQEVIYPDNYIKLRFLENHDQLRAAFQFPDPAVLRNWTAFCHFQKGTALIYGGQERSAAHRPTLFDKDPVDWSGADLTPLLRRLYQVKKNPLMADGFYDLKALPNDVALVSYEKEGKKLLGVFALKGGSHLVKVPAADGLYTNLADGSPVEVAYGQLSLTGEPVILEG